jgi:transposase
VPHLGTKSGDYHDEMNSTNFENWLRTQLIPNLPPHSVLVLDNASYHNVVDKKDPCSNTRKAEMIEWLSQKNIPYNPTMTKPELYDIIKIHRNKSPDYRMDKILKEHGHEILRLPPYSPEFNPIENIWGIVKNWVASHNVSFKLKDVEILTRQKFAEITPDVWKNTVNHVKKTEIEFLAKQNSFDEVIDGLSFVVNTGSSDEESDCTTSDSDGSDISGISPLD